MADRPDHAFILAAGKGTRLRPYTDSVPKPLVEVGGRSLIDRILDRLTEAGVERVTVNLHYMADTLEDHLSRRTDMDIAFSREAELLDTGGGIKNVLDTLGEKPFYVIAGDSLWSDGPSGSTLLRLADHWNDDTMDILTLLQPLPEMILTQGVGDFDRAADGRVIRRPAKDGSYMWTNIRINHPRIFRNAPDGPFSVLPLMDEAERQGRFYSLIHDGEWHHISTPGDLERVDATMRRRTVPA